MVTIEIAINSTRCAQQFALHPAGIEVWKSKNRQFGMEVMLLVSSYYA